MKTYLKQLPLWLTLTASVPALTGCIDEGDDLSDVDTTVRIAVNDLVIPINIDAITLSTVLDLNDASADGLVRVVDGAYAAVVDGSFSSDPIYVAPIVLREREASTFSAPLTTPTGSSVVGIPYPVTQPVYISSDYGVQNVSQTITSVTRLGLDWSYGLKISVVGASAISSMELRDLVLQFPKGLTATPSAGTYDAATGLVSIPTLPLSNGSATVVLQASGLEVSTAGLVYDRAAQTMKLDAQVGVVSGNLVPLALSGSTKPEGLSLSVATQAGALTVKSFGGILDYVLSGFSLPEVSLSGLPDVLSQSSTNLTLLNPQLYLALTNPVAPYGATNVSTGLTLTPVRDGLAGTPCSPDGGSITIATSANTGQGSVVMAPSDPSTRYPGYAAALFARFTSLPSLLSGDGLPSAIRIEASNAGLRDMAVAGFPLGTLGRVEGSYTFFAPLQFEAGSTVVYTGTDSGWHSEELEYLTIETMTVTANVSSTLPMDVDVTVTPLDEAGNPIDAVVEGAHIAAGASGAKFTVTLRGQVTQLDGVRYEARAVVPQSASSTALAPSQQLSFSDIRICVGGYYQKEL